MSLFITIIQLIILNILFLSFQAYSQTSFEKKELLPLKLEEAIQCNHNLECIDSLDSKQYMDIFVPFEIKFISKRPDTIFSNNQLLSKATIAALSLDKDDNLIAVHFAFLTPYGLLSEVKSRYGKPDQLISFGFNPIAREYNDFNINSTTYFWKQLDICITCSLNPYKDNELILLSYFICERLKDATRYSNLLKN